MFPREELFGITSQLRRAAVSVELNIAEGTGRRSNGDFARFVGIARGSACEVENLLILACDLGFLESQREQDLQTRVAEISRMLSSLSASVKQ